MLIAALGSSFAAGPTLEPVADRAAMRSALNYPHRLAAAVNADLVDLTVSGATTGTVVDTAQVIAPGVRFPPQIEGVPAGTDLVTVTVGGNDLQFVGAMLATAWQRHEPDGALAKQLHRMIPRGLPAPDLAAELGGALARVVGAVRNRAPKARVLLVDYLTVFDADAVPAGVTFTQAELAVFRRRQQVLVDAHEVAARTTGVELVAVSEHSQGHGLGSTEPWVNDFIPEARRTAGSFHPNAAGMQAVADVIVTRLLGRAATGPPAARRSAGSPRWSAG